MSHFRSAMKTAGLLLSSVVAVSIRPVWLLYGLGGLAAGLCARFLFSHAEGVIRLLSRLVKPLALAALLALLYFWTSLNVLYYRAPPRQLPAVNYATRIDLSTERGLWTVRSELTLIPQDNSRDYPDFRRHEPEPDAALELQKCGWFLTDPVRAVRERAQVATVRWLPVSSLNSISLDEDVRCGPITFRIVGRPQVVLFVPKFAVRKTYPDTSRSDLLSSDNERLNLSADFSYAEDRIIQIELVSPLFRNAIGEKLLAGAFWAPLVWIWATLCGIFAEQIKQGLFVPVAKQLCRAFGIPWQEGKKGDDSKDKPLIIVP